jgi:hypothetical protein
MTTSHKLIAKEEDLGVRFTCSVCGEDVLFEYPEIGSPSPVKNADGSWSAPNNVDLYMSDCNYETNT